MRSSLSLTLGLAVTLALTPPLPAYADVEAERSALFSALHAEDERVREAAATDRLQGILQFSDTPIVSTDIIGMWTTYPARPINGVMVSDYLPYGKERENPLANLVYPDSLTGRVVDLRVDPSSLTADVLLPFLNADDLAAVEAEHPRDIEKLRDILD